MGRQIDIKSIKFDEAGTNPQHKMYLEEPGLYTELPCSLPTSSQISGI
jgi:hypothetical protein